ncbi:MAG: ATP-binding cassette domain-containing protein [Bacteroidetes bacterium]|jgi:ABC-type multidrug transport system ATPase subunit|nr:ATP-binding cassette domain-containing protein [Bacteroidota bacterium]
MQLQIDNVSKTYPNGTQALKDVTLCIPEGLYGLLGPNGAGKSTLMRTIATLQEPDAGSITLEADDAAINVLTEKRRVRRRLGYLPQAFGLYPKARADQLLDHFAVMKGITNAAERAAIVDALLDRTNLQSARTQQLDSYSGGMKQRFGIAVALLGDPKLIIVDEPTAGLDPAERTRFLNLLSELGEDSIVILSTHIVKDVRELCANMAIIREGRIVFEGSPVRAVNAMEGAVWQRTVPKEELAEHEAHYDVLSTKLVAGRPVIRILAEAAPEERFASVPANLEDVYFAQMKGLRLNGDLAGPEASVAQPNEADERPAGSRGTA